MIKRKLWGLLYILIVLGTLAAAEWGCRTVSVMVEAAPLKRGNCIIIDAGHGGEDGGATSCRGVLESTYNLEISLRLNDLFHLLGYDTRMIRTTDTSIYTKGETIAQKKISDLKERVRIVNKTENALLLSIHQNNFTDRLVSTLNPGSNRKCKKSDGVYLMEHIDCTGVLIECGFLSNAVEEAKLSCSTYQKKLCCVIAATVSQYLSNT